MTLISTSVLVAGCSQTVAGNFCDLAKPFYPSEQAAAAFTRLDKEFLVYHNETGERECDWKARK